MITQLCETDHGDCPLFRSLESHIVSSVSSDTCEWKRSLGRPIKNVRVEAAFQPFDTAVLEKYKKGEWSILEHPVLHIYVTECSDVETYKSTVKEEIDNWLRTLACYDITDWMILLVETLDIRKTKNILPRTTVLDKIRLDFASKTGDRCISLLNPMKFEQKANESSRCLLQRIRHLMLTGYNKNIMRYEELIRTNREKRNQENWCFIRYFLLQEQLAFVLEMLGLHMEALVQYDELDAMFSQFILNSVFGEKQKWLVAFERPFSSFHGITMNRAEMAQTRTKIVENSATLLEFRSYLFERQAILLGASGRPWEIAERLLSFLFSTLREIDALKIETSEGSLACWEFVCALEVLNMCEEVNDTTDIHKSSQFCAPIWNLAKDKLYELGKLCGLLPGCTPTSEQLHAVVQLSAGIGDTVERDTGPSSSSDESGDAKVSRRPPKQSSTERLKEALGSNHAFQKLYLELAELAISTYKHVSRLRSARLVGLDLGNFYCTLNEPHKAIVFFTDLLRELRGESWNYLASQTLLELASCYKKMDDHVNYTKTCSGISCCIDLEMLVRTFYFDEFLKSLRVLPPHTDTQFHTAVLEDHIQIVKVAEAASPIIQDNMIVVRLSIESNFPREIIAEKVAISYETCLKTLTSPVDVNLVRAIVPMSVHLDYKQDNTLQCASVVCDVKSSTKNSVRRSSSTKRKISPTVRSDFSNALVCMNVPLKPGPNVIEVTGKATRVGIWSYKQISIQIQNLDYLSEAIPVKTKPFEVTTIPSSAGLNFMNLVAGLEQSMTLMVAGGSFVFPKESSIVLKCSRSLKMKLDGDDGTFERELKIDLSGFRSFEERGISLRAICDLPGRREEKHIEQKVALQVPWSRTDIQVPLHFLPALIASCRLHSSGSRKFLQVVIKAIYDSKLILSEPTMKCASKGVTLSDINPRSLSEITIQKNLTVSFLWEIQVEPLKTEAELSTIQIEFGMKYAAFERPDIRRNYTCTFDVSDYTTLFKIHAKVEPSELCRVGSVCSLQLRISKTHDSPFTELMYEVLTDQNTWAVCGRAAGVVTMTNVEHTTIMLEVLPLSAGFLPLPTIRLSKYIAADKTKAELHPKLQPFPPGQIYNSTKSMQIHVLASNNAD